MRAELDFSRRALTEDLETNPARQADQVICFASDSVREDLFAEFRDLVLQAIECNPNAVIQTPNLINAAY